MLFILSFTQKKNVIYCSVSEPTVPVAGHMFKSRLPHLSLIKG